MINIKICGLRTPEDIRIVNTYKPDYAGFIVNYPKSFRSVDTNILAQLTSQLDASIQSVGVFVDEDFDVVKQLLDDQVIQVAQLHGHEDETYIAKLQADGHTIIKAFTIHHQEDMDAALQSCADIILLDQGKGSGQTFDWSIVPTISRPYLLAGGLDQDNIQTAINQLHPWGIDLSSGVETNQSKDEDKIRACIALCKRRSA